MRRIKTLIEERFLTIRDDIVQLLMEKEATIKEISGEVRIPEKNVFDHLEHIKLSMANKGFCLHIVPAQCLKCGFVFKKREKIKTPSRCPLCKGEHIQDAMYKLVKK